jgi:hypothetical protein
MSNHSLTGYISNYLDESMALIGPSCVFGFDVSSGEQNTTEGDEITFTVKLKLPPYDSVMIPIISNNTKEATVSPENLTFKIENWNVEQVVTIKGQIDGLVDGDQDYSIIVGPTISGDSNFDNLDQIEINLTNKDDGNRFPEAPELISPQNQSNNLDTEIVFKWYESLDPDGDSVSYDLYICENESFSGCEPISTNISSASLKSNKKYWPNMALIFSFFGFSFLIGLFKRKKIGFIIILIILSLGFVCSSDSPEKDEKKYEVEGIETGLKYSDLKENTLYYWMVAAKDTRGASSFSVVWNFKTK